MTDETALRPFVFPVARVQAVVILANGCAHAEEEGRLIMRQDSRFIGPDLGELTAKAIPGYIELIGKSFQYLAESLDR